MGIEAAIIGSALVGGYSANRAASKQDKAAEKGVDAQERAAMEQIAAQERMFERQVGLQEPWRQAGVNALTRLQGMAEYQPFTMDKFQADPGYAFRLSEGMKALERGAAARGGLLSGAALKATQRYGQDLASQEYQNAFNRYQAERASALQPYQSLAGIGQTSANALTGAAGQLGQGLAATYGGLGAAQAAGYGQMGGAQASGYMGMANALAGAGSQYLGYQQNQALLNALRGQQSYTATNPYYDTPGAGWAGGGP